MFRKLLSLLFGVSIIFSSLIYPMLRHDMELIPFPAIYNDVDRLVTDRIDKDVVGGYGGLAKRVRMLFLQYKCGNQKIYDTKEFQRSLVEALDAYIKDENDLTSVLIIAVFRQVYNSKTVLIES
jgi:hypothetical protein